MDSDRWEEHEMEDLEDLEPVDANLESDVGGGNGRAATVRNRGYFRRPTDGRNSLERTQRRRQKSTVRRSTQNQASPPRQVAQAGPAAPTQNRNGKPAMESSVDEVDLASPLAESVKPHISLCQAVRYGNKEIVERWMSYNKNQPHRNRERDSHGLAPIHYAAKFNQAEIMKILCDKGEADICAVTTTEEYTPLHFAARFCPHSSYEDVSCGTATEQTAAPTESGSINRRFSHQMTCEETMSYIMKQRNVDVNAKNTYGITPLHLACQVGNLQGVKLLIDHEKITLDAKDYNGDTPLHEACYHGNEKITEALLDKMKGCDKLDLTIKNKLELTPLHLACREGQTKIVALLLKTCRCNLWNLIMLTDKEGATAVHLACYNDNEDIIKMLLEERAIAPAQTEEREIAPAQTEEREIAPAQTEERANAPAQTEEREIAPAQTEERANAPVQTEERANAPAQMEKSKKVLAETEDGITPLHLAAKYGCLKVMNLLLEGLSKENVNVRDIYDQTPLHFAAENGKEEMLKFLLEKNANPEAKDVDLYTPLLTAAEFGRVGCLRVLLEHNACPKVQNRDGKNAVFLAAESDHLDVVEEILKLPDHMGKRIILVPDILLNTSLHAAAEKGNLEVLNKLLSHWGMKKDNKNVSGKTAMHLAAEKGHVHIITALEDSCSDMAKSTDENGDTPLHLACKFGYVEVANQLIKMGADIEARNAVQWTPLDCAAYYGHARVIEVLVTLVPEIDPIDKLKTTPLHLAAKEGHVTAVETLLENNASITSLDSRDFNALDWAIENGHSDVAEAIIKSFRWKDALNNYTKTQDGKITSPFRKLIQRMPDVAEMVLNKCTTTNSTEKDVSPDSEKYEVIFDYIFMEDRDRALEWKMDVDMESETMKQASVGETSIEETIRGTDKESGGVTESRKKKRFRDRFNHLNLKHPMKVMVESERTRLLKHPLVFNLINHKWSKYGYGLFYTMLGFHVGFVILLMAFSLILLNPFSPTCAVVLSGQFNLTQPGDQVTINTSQVQSPHTSVLMDYLSATNATVTDGIATLDGPMLCFNVTETVHDAVDSVTSVQAVCGECDLSKTDMVFLFIAAVVIIIYSIIRLIFELAYLCQQRLHYYSEFTNWGVNIPLCICAIIFVFVFHSDCFCPQVWQWQIGIVAVFLVWAHLILYMRRMLVLDTGIYVLMFKNIIIRFLKLTILTVLLLCMFALTFYMTFRQFHRLFNHSPFANPFHSIWKTVAMSIGDLGYDSLFRQPTSGSTEEIPSIPFPEISYILWIAFVVLMPILFGNLLVGLAVDDIKGILEAAVLTRLALQVELVLSLEDRFRWLTQLFNVAQGKREPLTVCPNKKNKKRFISRVLRLLVGEDYCSAEHISHVLNPTKNPIEQQTQTLMREISKIQETLREIPKVEEMQETLKVIPKIEEIQETLKVIPKIEEIQETLKVIPKLEEKLNKLLEQFESSSSTSQLDYERSTI